MLKLHLEKSMFKLILTIVALLSVINISCRGSKNGDKLLLSPVELIDLVRKEEHKNKIPSAQKKFFATDSSYEQDQSKDESDLEPAVACEDEKTLKSRKVWSRWSKWGECSVTCGGGTITRHRVCLAGRCAHGEREEQRRPCARAPCLISDYNMTDELHDFK